MNGSTDSSGGLCTTRLAYYAACLTSEARPSDMSGPMDKDTKDQLAGQLLFPMKGERKPPRIRATPEEASEFFVTLKGRITNDRRK